MQNFIIAIDGPAGAGKSSIAKKVAEKIHYTYIDSGAMYRALTLKILSYGIALDDNKTIIDIAQNTDIDFCKNRIYLDGVNVDTEIRGENINKNVSIIAAIPQVRKIMVDKQRAIAAEQNVVMDGRDVGTVIFPEAFIKFYITASVEERALRRYKQLMASAPLTIKEELYLDDIKRQIEERDFIDMNRAEAPLIAAEDAKYIDTSNKSLNQVIDEVIYYITQHGGENHAIPNSSADTKTNI